MLTLNQQVLKLKSQINFLNQGNSLVVQPKFAGDSEEEEDGAGLAGEILQPVVKSKIMASQPKKISSKNSRKIASNLSNVHVIDKTNLDTSASLIFDENEEFYQEDKLPVTSL